MDFVGLIGKYRANRLLTEQERVHQLKQAQRCDVEPHYQMSVIQLNSTYLELVDKWYGGKGGCRLSYKFWNIMEHLMADDGTTVLESFALSISETGAPDGLVMMRSHWEFVRRYMEDGPSSVSGQVQFCLPISHCRETWSMGMHRLLANNSGAPLWMLPMTVFSMAFDLATVPFRYFAMRTSKVPAWPSEVEAVNAIDPEDPYAIEGDERGDRKAVFPHAAQVAGVGFVAQPGNPLVSQRRSR